MSRQGITVLGATGSIGLQTLEVLALNPERYDVFALAAFTRWQELGELCLRFRPRYAVLKDTQAAANLRQWFQQQRVADIEVLEGEAALNQVAAAPEAELVVAAIVGAAGVASTFAAVRAGKTVLLANKESLVVTGQLLMDAVAKHGATLLPVDSEHNAIFQSLPGGCVTEGVSRLVLTASGGPFRTWDKTAIQQATIQQALNHPNWSMGPKITVDSASLMNKGLELIEAHWLFGLPESRIDVVVHPQSVIHSMVEYRDGSVLAQLGTPDMRTPIACCLAWPERIASGASRLDFARLAALTFEEPDLDRFPALRIARETLRSGGVASAIMNAANEEAVAAFLAGELPFGGIAACVEHSLETIANKASESVEAVLATDAESRHCARVFIQRAG